LTLHETDEQWSAEVARQFPIGMPILEAIQILEENGFRCEKTADDRGLIIVARVWRKESLFISRDWSIVITHNEESIAGIESRTWLTGP
jgi:hypothetical protein